MRVRRASDMAGPGEREYRVTVGYLAFILTPAPCLFAITRNVTTSFPFDILAVTCFTVLDTTPIAAAFLAVTFGMAIIGLAVVFSFAAFTNNDSVSQATWIDPFDIAACFVRTAF